MILLGSHATGDSVARFGPSYCALHLRYFVYVTRASLGYELADPGNPAYAHRAFSFEETYWG